jgi:hypothetical protein
MPSLARYIRGIRAVGIKEWWRQMQYIGDVKVGTFVGSDQCVPCFCPPGQVACLTSVRSAGSETVISRTSTQNRRCQVRVFVLQCFQCDFTKNNLGRHRWVDLAQVSRETGSRSMLG